MFIFLETVRFICVDLVLEVIYFPIWYYTSGTIKVVHQMNTHIRALGHSLNLRTLWVYLFQPMYGQTDIWGRVISFFMRGVQFIVVSILSFFYSVLWCILLLLWLMLPVVLIIGTAYHLGWLATLPWLTDVISSL